MKNILITKNIAQYRVPFYNQLAKSGFVIYAICTDNIKKNNISLNPKIEIIRAKRVGLVIWPVEKIFIPKCSNIVTIFDLRLMPWVILVLGLKNTFLWGIGYGKNNFANKLRSFMIKKSRGLISYMPYGQLLTNLSEYDRGGYLVNSVFPDQPKNLWNADSKKIIFIGSIDQRKRLDLLIYSLDILRSLGYIWNATIIGDGNNRNKLENLTKKLFLDNQIKFYGAVFNNDKKNKLVANAFLCVQPGQAGLSVLESFSYGIPVLTFKNAISGGERDNVVNGATGYFFDKLCPINLALTILKLSKIKDEVSRVSDNCFRYFTHYASGDFMVNRFINIINKNKIL